MRNRVGKRGKPALASRSCSLQMEGGQAAYLLVGTCQLLFQGGHSLQGHPEPLSHLSKIKGEMKKETGTPLDSSWRSLGLVYHH